MIAVVFLLKYGGKFEDFNEGSKETRMRAQ